MLSKVQTARGVADCGVPLVGLTSSLGGFTSAPGALMPSRQHIERARADPQQEIRRVSGFMMMVCQFLCKTAHAFIGGPTMPETPRRGKAAGRAPDSPRSADGWRRHRAGW